MASTPESKVKAKVRKHLEGVGAYYVMPVTSGYGRQGAPDFLVCYHGKFIGIECKANGGKTTALQEKNLRQIEDAGGIAMVVNEDNIESVAMILSLL